MPMNIGTDQNFLISNALPKDLKSVDSFAKMNIMTEAHEDPSTNVPQIVLSQTTDNVIKTWNGDRLMIDYASGNDGAYFSISEVTGSYRNRLNFELFGQDNSYNGLVEGTYGNSLIYSRSNRLNLDSHDLSFIHSNYNVINATGINNINFLQSDNNTFNANLDNGEYAGVNEIGLYNSDNNTFRPTNKLNSANNAYSGNSIKNIVMFNSDNNTIKGRTESVGYNGVKDNKTTFINSNSGFYNFNSDQDSITMIGNSYGYIDNISGGNIIGIGQGLVQNGGNSDKIILGFYNENSTNPDELLIVGDGKLNRNVISGFNSNPQATLSSVTGVGATALNSNNYRHNIFTVNKNGYITISDYKIPSNSARYGYKGITAYVNGAVYDVSFEDLYNKIDGNDAIDMIQEKIDSYSKQIQNKLDSMPTLRYETFEDPSGLASNVKTSAYLNIEAPSDVDAAIQISNLDSYTNNSILNISYQPDINSTNKRLPATLIWTNYIPVDAGTPQVKYVYSTDIYPYCTKQFIFCKPFYPLDKNSQKPFSGLTLIEQETKNNIGISTATLPIVASNWVVQKTTVVGEVSSYTYYCGPDDNYAADNWTTVDESSYEYTIFDNKNSATNISTQATAAGEQNINVIPVIL